MAFIKVGTLMPFGAPVLRLETITNTTTVTVENALGVASGFIVNASGTTYAVFGHCAGIETAKGVGLNTTGAAGAAMGSFINAYTTASDNQTVAQVKAVVDISKHTLYTNPTNGTLGATTGSNLLGYYLNLATGSATTIDETSATTTRGSTNYFNWGVSPNNSTLIVVNIETSLIQA